MGEFLKENLSKLIDYKGRLLGSGIGLITGLLWAFKSFKAAFVFLLCTLGGYYIGKRMDQKDSISEILSRVLPPKS